ncbi:hypothetical protein VNO77_18345 [Canavalia gladiata]|uniref:26S proteasome non-ATPase regulatory subunit 1/RPN2 N-terminal domain-containing protein n=1 Tax=Canavalia gladiata TaxID=3824 RepID=A0AAN9QNL6_CANGL
MRGYLHILCDVRVRNVFILRRARMQDFKEPDLLLETQKFKRKLNQLVVLRGCAYGTEQNGCDTGVHSGYATGWSLVRRQLAALLVSKIFHYLGELNDSVSYALGAGPLFDVSEVSDCVHTLLAKAIDEYASSKSKATESSDESIKVDSRLEVITGSDNVQGTLSYCIYVPHSFVNLKEYRQEVLRILVKVFQKLPSPDYLSIGQCFMSLDGLEGVASILEKLLRSENKDDALLALQIAFDLVGNEHQAFLLNVKDRLASLKSQPPELRSPSPVTQLLLKMLMQMD